MKKTIISLFILFAVSASTFSQDFLEINMEDIKEKTTDDLSYLYYPILLERFSEFDETLSQEDFKYLYYGYFYTDMYSPYGGHEKEDLFFEHYYDKEYDEAIIVGQEIIAEDPINTKLLFKMVICYYQTEDKEMSDKYAALYYGLLQIIYYSGDGLSEETAFKVINVSDEYEILSELGLQSAGQALVGSCDRLTIDTENQEVEEGQEPIEELYFDVSLPFEYLNKQFMDE